MNVHATLVLALAGAAVGQDMEYYILPTTQDNLYVVGAEYLGSLPSGATALAAAWSDARFTVSGASPVDYVSANPAYFSDFLGSPIVFDNGTTEAEFLGAQTSVPLPGDPPLDSSNPLLVVAFEYQGDPSELRIDLVQQNSVLFFDPGGFNGIAPVLLQDAQGNPGPLVAQERVFPLGAPVLPAGDVGFFRAIPAPAGIALAPFSLIIVARRRRK